MEEKLVLYAKIHELRKRKFRVAQIAKELKISRPTVYKYLEMIFDEANAILNSHWEGKKLDHYKAWMLAFLKITFIRVLNFMIGFWRDTST